MPFRFENFELESDGAELRRNGFTIRLERIPLQLLRLLVSRHGEVISREEIADELWGKDVFVDTDNGINTAIRKIRIALRDTPEQPRFIFTVPGRGYRFAGRLAEEPALGALTSPHAIAPAVIETVVYGESTDVDPSAVTIAETAPKLVAPDRAAERPGLSRWIVFAAIGICLLVLPFLLIERSNRAVRSSKGRVMLIVLPFQNLSGDPSQDYFVDGMTEELIIQLGALSPHSLGVIARTTSMQFKRSVENISQIASEVHVDYILEGSVRRSGDRIRITAQLIQANDQTHLWARNYDRETSDTLEIQDAIGRDIAEVVSATLPLRSPNDDKDAPMSATAHETYLRGRQGLNQRSRPGIISAIEQLQQAVALNPSFAPAWSALARTYSLSPVFNVLPPGVALPKARDAAIRALNLDQGSAEAHCTLGFVLAHYDFDWPSAEREFKRAIELNPSDANNHLFYANSYLSPQGRHDAAISEMQTAIVLDPLSFPVQSFMGRTLLWAGRDQDALSQFLKANLIDPNSALGHERLAHFFATLGRYAEAISEEEKARVLSGEDPEAAVAVAQRLRGALEKRGDSGYWEEELTLAAQPNHPPEFFIGSFGRAVILAQLSRKQDAVIALEQAKAEHDLRMTEIDLEPLLKPLRGDAAFREMQTSVRNVRP